MGSDIKVIFLGTNGWYCTQSGSTVSTLIDTPNCYIILDAGNGIYKADKYMLEDKPIYLFLSHLHLDHISGLHVLNKFLFPPGLYICGHSGIKEQLEAILKQPFTMPVRSLPFPVRFMEFDCGRQHGFPFGVEAQELVHSSRCYGYRFEFEQREIAYCTDTGHCENLIHLSHNTDLMITECGSVKEGDTAWPHLTPITAANAALEADAKKLVMTHFAADLYIDASDREDAQRNARAIFINSVAAYDEMIVKV